MTRSLIFLTLVLVPLAACQSVPATRENNCVCTWEILDHQAEGAIT